jgi:hypothetical protein
VYQTALRPLIAPKTNRINAITIRAWMKPPAVNEVTKPRPQRTRSTTAIVYSMSCLLLRERPTAIFADRNYSPVRHTTHFPIARRCATEHGRAISKTLKARRAGKWCLTPFPVSDTFSPACTSRCRRLV